LIALSVVLLLVALVLFGIAAFIAPARINLIAAGLFFGVASLLVGKVGPG
jgi:hypothetical protein